MVLPTSASTCGGSLRLERTIDIRVAVSLPMQRIRNPIAGNRASNTAIPARLILHTPGSDSKSTAGEFLTGDGFFSSLLILLLAQHPQYVAVLYK